jgi:hypothetical protein
MAAKCLEGKRKALLLSFAQHHPQQTALRRGFSLCAVWTRAPPLNRGVILPSNP